MGPANQTNVNEATWLPFQHGLANDGKRAKARESMKETRTKKITEAELQAAMRRFVEAGGMIKKLPDQKSIASQAVGVRWNNSDIGGEPN